MFVTKLAPNESEPPPLLLHPWYWGKPNHLFQSLPFARRFTAVEIDPENVHSIALVRHTLHQNERFRQETLSMRKEFVRDDQQFDQRATVMEALNRIDYNRTKISPSCDCWEKMQTCPVGGGGPAPNFYLTETKDVLYDLQGYNITDWYVPTGVDRVGV